MPLGPERLEDHWLPPCRWVPSGRGLVEALQEIGAGAKTATGYGRFVPDEQSEKAWRANAARERMRTGGPLERMRHLVGQMTEG